MSSSRNPSGETVTEKLLGSHQDEEEYLNPYTSSTELKSLKRWRVLAIVSTGLLLASLIYNIFQPHSRFGNGHIPYIYSPAENAISYEIKVFHSNFNEDRTPYQGPPTDAVDTAWEDLYNEVGINRITPAEAAQLPNATVRIPDDEGHYIVGLDVMHQLHCLNHLRKTLYPERYHVFENLTAEELGVAMDHTEHCVDSIRQSLMCSSDISTIYWSWNEERGRTLANAQTTHVCRNFEKIREWASERVVEKWDPLVNTEILL